MSSDLPFLMNEQGNTLRDRFRDLLGDNAPVNAGSELRLGLTS